MPGLERVKQGKVIAIVRGLKPEYMLKLADALYAGGIDCIEVTFNQAKPETWADTAAAIKETAGVDNFEQAFVRIVKGETK